MIELMFAASAQVLSGFSICAASVLLILYLFFLKHMLKSVLGQAASTVLMSCLIVLQGAHFWFFGDGHSLLDQRWYGLLLLTTPIAFFFFSREGLVPGITRSPLQALHLVPIAVGVFLPLNWLLPLSFVLGATYSAWFAMYVFGMRRRVNRYAFELFFFCYFAVLAILLLVLATSAQQIGDDVFHGAYAILIGLSFVLIVAALIAFPNVLTDVSDAARLTYASSTLGDVDVAAKATDLERLMTEERLFENEDLTLTMLADAVQLSTHQLSELINTHYNHGFSQFVRRHRVDAAKSLLLEDGSASVLSVGMSTGFRSQSNFYAAFKESTGMSPGAWRKHAR